MKIFKIQTYTGLWQRREGVALIEFAMVLPLLLLLIFGVIEISRYIQANQKAIIAAHNLADLITQNLAITDSEADSLLATAQSMMVPFDANAGNLAVTMSHIVKEPGQPPRAEWIRGWPNGHRATRLSGGEGSSATIPNFSFVDRDQIVAIEVFYTHRSMIGMSYTDPYVPDSEQFYKYAFARPRYGSLMEIQP